MQSTPGEARIRALQKLLADAALPRRSLPAGVARASVALVVRPAGDDLEVLLIRRAVSPRDPWSGHMALPGGRHDPVDPDAVATAVREAQEEVGIDLVRHGLLLGALDEVRPRPGAPLVAISPFVFAVPADTRTRVNHEVDVAVWIPLAHLAGPGAATEYLHALSGGEPLRFPALGYQEFVIWGLTHRILTQFLRLAEAPAEEGRGD